MKTGHYSSGLTVCDACNEPTLMSFSLDETVVCQTDPVDLRNVCPACFTHYAGRDELMIGLKEMSWHLGILLEHAQRALLERKPT